jgi:hypothetical protein
VAKGPIKITKASKPLGSVTTGGFLRHVNKYLYHSTHTCTRNPQGSWWWKMKSFKKNEVGRHVFHLIDKRKKKKTELLFYLVALIFRFYFQNLPSSSMSPRRCIIIY